MHHEEEVDIDELIETDPDEAQHHPIVDGFEDFGIEDQKYQIDQE